jgi:putative methyltransferase (TIGR04325 family)
MSILSKVFESIIAVRDGRAAYERDSVAFSDFTYNDNVRLSLVDSINRTSGSIVVADFGGSLGSLFFQYGRFLENVAVDWNVIEQSNFVDCGKKYLSTNELHFYYSIRECARDKKIDILILSSVLCYLENPYDWLEEFVSLGIPYLLIDRTAFAEGKKELLTVQVVPPEIYEASYPAWFLNEEKLLNVLLTKYDVLRELPDMFDGEDRVEGILCYRKGFFMRLKA